MIRFFLIIMLLTFFAMPTLALSATQVVDEIVASINGSIITRGELEENIRILKVFDIKDEIIPHQELEKIVINKMIDDYLLQQEAEKQGITISPVEVQRALEDLQKDIPYERFIQSLKEKGITLEALKEKLKRELLGQKIIKWKATGLREEVKIENSEIENFFILLKNYIEGKEEQNEDVIQFYGIYYQRLEEEEKVWIAQIIVDSKEKAEKIHQKLVKGEDFSRLAIMYSLGPNAKKGGDLGWISLSQIHRSLRGIISKLKEGEFTDPIKINEKFYRILQVKKRKQLSFEEWKERIESYLFNKKMLDMLDEWLKNLREKSFIQIMDKDLKKEWKN